MLSHLPKSIHVPSVPWEISFHALTVLNVTLHVCTCFLNMQWVADLVQCRPRSRNIGQINTTCWTKDATFTQLDVFTPVVTYSFRCATVSVNLSLWVHDLQSLTFLTKVKTEKSCLLLTSYNDITHRTCWGRTPSVKTNSSPPSILLHTLDVLY